MCACMHDTVLLQVLQLEIPHTCLVSMVLQEKAKCISKKWKIENLYMFIHL